MTGDLSAGSDERAVPSADATARDRILAAAEGLFAESGFDATPTSRIAERAGVPKGLVHYYFRRKTDLLAALIDRLPDERIDHRRIVVPGDVAESLRRLVAALDAWLDSSALLSHLLWREADTHAAVRHALHARYQRVADHAHRVISEALPHDSARTDVRSAAALLARAVSYRHSVARHSEQSGEMDRELVFIADALAMGAGSPKAG